MSLGPRLIVDRKSKFRERLCSRLFLIAFLIVIQNMQLILKSDHSLKSSRRIELKPKEMLGHFRTELEFSLKPSKNDRFRCNSAWASWIILYIWIPMILWRVEEDASLKKKKVVLHWGSRSGVASLLWAEADIIRCDLLWWSRISKFEVCDTIDQRVIANVRWEIWTFHSKGKEKWASGWPFRSVQRMFVNSFWCSFWCSARICYQFWCKLIR